MNLPIKVIFAFSLLFVCYQWSTAQSWQQPKLQVLYQAGTKGYDQMRIPSIIKAADGTLLAFAEARKTAGDAGDIDLVCRRSSDQGKSWSEMFTIWDDGENTCGNPCPVLDQQSGTIFLLMTQNLGHDGERDIIRGTAESTRTVWVAQSDDHGNTWTQPGEITSEVKKPEWGWFATGPGVGIQIQQGPRQGRLVVPCDFSYTVIEEDQQYEYGSHVIYSDDHGKTWQLGGTITPKVNECQMVELSDGNGTLLINMRSYFGRNLRTQSVSYDGGASWTSPADVPDLVEPVCQASMIRFTSPGDDQSLLLFGNPASTNRRHNFTIRGSHDDGKSWPLIRTIFPGPSAYSSMVRLNDEEIGVFFEGGDASPYENIYFTTINISNWLP